jgi:hypothetical protein
MASGSKAIQQYHRRSSGVTVMKIITPSDFSSSCLRYTGEEIYRRLRGNVVELAEYLSGKKPKVFL